MNTRTTISAFILLVLVPFHLIWFLRVQTPLSQQFLFLTTFATAITGWYLSRKQFAVGGDQPYLGKLILYSCLLLLSAILWNYIFLDYIRTTGYQKDIFRGAFQNLHAPIYGRPNGPRNYNYYVFAFFPAILLVLYCSFWAYRYPQRNHLPAWIALQILLTLGFAHSYGDERIVKNIAHYLTFSKDLSFFGSIGDILENYTSKMDQLGVHNQHYPPGNLILLKLEQMLGFPAFTKLVVIGFSALTILPLTEFAKLCRFSHSAVIGTQLLFITSPGILIFPTLDLVPIVMCLGSEICYVYLHGLKSGKVVHGILVGVLLAAYTFFSFSSSLILLFMVIFLLTAAHSRLVPFHRGTKILILSAVSFVSVYFLIYLSAGFNMLECFQKAVLQNRKQMSSGFDDGWRYAIRTSGALLAYFIGAGFPLAVLGCHAARKLRKDKHAEPWTRSFAIAFILTLGVAACSGLFFLETERVWLFFTPGLALLAGKTLGEGTQVGVRTFIVLFAVLLGLGQEIFFNHFL